MRRDAVGAVVVSLVGAAVLTGLAGCSALGPVLGPKLGTQGYEFDGIWGSQSFAFPSDEVRPAVLDGMLDMKMKVANQSSVKGEQPAIVIDGQAHDGRHARVTIRPGPVGAVVSARIGRFGDDDLCEALMKRVGIRLGTLPPESIPESLPSSGPVIGRFFSKDAVPDEVMFRDPVHAGTVEPFGP